MAAALYAALLLVGMAAYGAALGGDIQTTTKSYEYAPGGRLGAICADGWRSSAIGRGACSHHGGVAYWVYSETRYAEIRDTFLARHETVFWWIGHVAMTLLFCVTMPVLLDARDLAVEPSRGTVSGITPRRQRLAADEDSESKSGGSGTDPTTRSAETPHWQEKFECPRCGSRLVRGRRRRGSAFLWCSAAPRCRFRHDV